MDNPLSGHTYFPLAIGNTSASSTARIQSGEVDLNFSVQRDMKARQFAEMLNRQQHVTELTIKFDTTVFDPAQNIEINAPYSHPAKAMTL